MPEVKTPTTEEAARLNKPLVGGQSRSRCRLISVDWTRPRQTNHIRYFTLCWSLYTPNPVNERAVG